MTFVGALILLSGVFFMWFVGVSYYNGIKDDIAETFFDVLEEEHILGHGVVSTNFAEYEDVVLRFARYPGIAANYTDPALGLCGEAGEYADKIKNIIRDKGGVVSKEDRVELLKELGDVLWYVTASAMELDSSLDEVANMNLTKLIDRNKRNVIHGEGDNR